MSIQSPPRARGFPVNPDIVLSAVGYLPVSPTCGTCKHHKTDEDAVLDRSWVEHCLQFGTLGPIVVQLGGVCDNYAKAEVPDAR